MSKQLSAGKGRKVSTRMAMALAMGATVAAGLVAAMPSASAGSGAATANTAVFAPAQSIRYDFGSKSMSGYFVEEASACHVVVMVSEAIDPDKSEPPSGARVRLVLAPGEIAGLDSEEGRSLNFTCGKGGKTLLVDAGEAGRLFKRQTHRETATE